MISPMLLVSVWFLALTLPVLAKSASKDIIGTASLRGAVLNYPKQSISPDGSYGIDKDKEIISWEAAQEPLVDDVRNDDNFKDLLSSVFDQVVGLFAWAIDQSAACYHYYYFGEPLPSSEHLNFDDQVEYTVDSLTSPIDGIKSAIDDESVDYFSLDDSLDDESYDYYYYYYKDDDDYSNSYMYYDEKKNDDSKTTIVDEIEYVPPTSFAIHIGNIVQQLLGIDTTSSIIDIVTTLLSTISSTITTNTTITCHIPPDSCNPNGVACPLDYAPVCGCDNNTYSNACEARYFGCVTTWTEGPCSGNTTSAYSSSEVDWP
jgi:hypothetical protein